MTMDENNQMEMVKSALVLNYMFVQAVLYTFGGDLLQKESEAIFHTLYEITWFTLPASLMKDIRFAMMRAKFPFRLTGGKFFHINRETMVAVLKTAASYISVLRIALMED